MLTTSHHIDTDNTRPLSGAKLTVVSVTAGRMRVRLHGCRLDPVHILKIEETVGKVAGVRSVQGYMRTASLVIWYCPGRCDRAAILLAIVALEQIPAPSMTALDAGSSDTGEPSAVQHIIGWAARILNAQRDDPARTPGTSGRDARGLGRDETEAGTQQSGHSVTLRRAAWSGTLLTASMLTASITPLAPVALPLKILSLALGASTFVTSAVQGVGQGRVGVDTLKATATLGAVGLGQVGDAAKMACVVSLTEGLEERSAVRSRRNMQALLALAPDQATVWRQGAEIVVDAGELRVGDLMIMRPGERLATDGVIRAGRSVLDVSAVSGASTQVVAAPGDAVFAGTTNGHGILRVEVTATAVNNSLTRIVQIVDAHGALEETGRQFADRAARPLVPGLLIAALLTAATGSLVGSPALWLKRALLVLATGSPYAMEAIGIVRGIAVDQVQTLAAQRPLIMDPTVNPHSDRQHAQAVPLAMPTDCDDLVPAAVA